MNSCKLLVYYPEDFRIFSGTCLNESRTSIKLQNASAEDLKGAIAIKLKWFEGTLSKYAEADIKGGQDGIFDAAFTSDIRTDNDDSHFIEYRERFQTVRVDPELIGEYRYRVDKVNNRYRSSLATQIKKIITDETLTNQYMFKLLLQIDSKLEELLDSLKQEDIVEGLTETKMLSFGGSDLSFLHEGEALRKDDLIYVQSMPKSGAGINFAALVKVDEIIPAGDKQICEAGYEYIDESTRETIIHYIFQKDREQLKRNRN